MAPTVRDFCNDVQLRQLEERVHTYEGGATYADKTIMAAEDVLRDLQRLGMFDRISFPDYDYRGSLPDQDGDVYDDGALSTVTLTFTAATGNGDLTVPAGTLVYVRDPSTTELETDRGLIAFATDALLTVPDGTSATVAATALYQGRAHNVAADRLIFAPDLSADTAFSSVTNAAPSSGGIDHQLARLTAYRTLELIYADLYRLEGDALWSRMELYRRKYKDELDRVVAAGVRLDFDGDDELDEDEERRRHGHVQLGRA